MKKTVDIIAVIGHGILKAGIRQLIKEIVPGNKIEFIPTLQDCLNGKICPEYLIVESSSIPEPINYSLERIKSKNKKGKILLIEMNYINDTLKTYISNVIYKDDTEQSILKKLNTYFDTAENKKAGDDTLSDREKEIVELVALGKTNKEISDELFISPHTVITHRKNITTKLGIRTIAGLTVYAVLNEIISPEDI